MPGLPGRAEGCDIVSAAVVAGLACAAAVAGLAVFALRVRAALRAYDGACEGGPGEEWPNENEAGPPWGGW